MSNSLLKYINNKGVGPGIDDVAEYASSNFPDPGLVISGTNAQLGNIRFTVNNGAWVNLGGSYIDFKNATTSNQSLKFKDGTFLQFDRYYNDSPFCKIYMAFVSSEPVFDDSRIKVESGWLMQIFPNGKAAFECFGAYGDYVQNPTRNDNAALQSTLKYAKGVMQLIYIQARHISTQVEG